MSEPQCNEKLIIYFVWPNIYYLSFIKMTHAHKKEHKAKQGPMSHYICLLNITVVSQDDQEHIACIHVDIGTLHLLNQ